VGNRCTTGLWSRAWLRFAALGFLTLVLLGCGTGEDSQSQPNGGTAVRSIPLDGMESDRLAFGAVATEDGIAILNGGASTPDGPRAVLHWTVGQGSAILQTQVPLDLPLFDVSIWWTGSEVVVLGIPCSRWTDSNEPPSYEEQTGPLMSELCGSSSYQVWAWSPSIDQWRPVKIDGLEARNGLRILSTHNSQAITLPTSTLPQPPPYLLNVKSETLKRLGPLPEDGTTPESAFNVCIGSDGTVGGLLVWDSRSVPSKIAHGDWPADLVRTIDHPGGALRAIALTARGSNDWDAVPLAGPLGEIGTNSPTCGADGIVFGPGNQATVVRVSKDRLVASALPPLTADRPLLLRVSPGCGTTIALEYSSPSSPEAVDIPRSTRVWRLEDGSWVAAKPVPYSLGSTVLLCGDLTIVVAGTTTKTDQGGLQVQVV